MKAKNTTTFSKSILCLLITIIFGTLAIAQKLDLEKRAKISEFQSALDTYHISHDSGKVYVTQRVTRLFLHGLESEIRLFTENHVSKLEATLKDFQDRPIGSCLQFLDSAVNIYNHQLALRQAFLDSIKNIEFSQFDTLSLYANVGIPRFYKSPKELKASWLKMLKFNVLARQASDSLASKDIEELLIAEKCRLNNLANPTEGMEELMLEKFFQAYAKSYDPHSDYFSIKTEKQFTTELSDQMISCGLLFQRVVSGELVVTDVLPNSSAAATDISPGDRVIQVKTNSKDSHPACLSDQELYDCFFSEDQETIEVKIKSSKSTKIHTYELLKISSKNIFNEVLSASADGGEVKMGYIHLPSFYINQSNYDIGAAEELAKIIINQKRSGAQGLILDLRDNGGGSIDEAIDLSGFFINYGPLFQTVSSFNNTPETQKDYKKGSLFSDELLILTNTNSASASEMLLSAMKSNRRVIHAGSTTFGKASGQSILPLKTHEYLEPFGYIKVSTLQIYDLLGNSYQGKGFIPDIPLPDQIPSHLVNEHAALYKFKNKPVQATNTKTFDPPIFIPLDSIKSKHFKRMKNDSLMTHLWHVNDSIEELGKKPWVIPLSLAYFQQGFWDMDTDILRKGKYKLSALSKTFNNEVLLNRLSSDPNLIECFNVLEDWILLNEKQ